MKYSNSFSFGPPATPLPLKLLLLSIGICSFFSFWLIPYLALSLPGIEHGFFWQLATYPLIHPFPLGIFQLLMNLYLIWTFGASLMERIGKSPFFILYFGSALAAGSFALLGMSFTHTIAPMMGSASVLFAILVSWTLLNLEAQLLLFFAISMKARHLILIFIGVALLVNLSNGDWVHLLANVGSLMFGYLFTLIVCRVHSQVPFLRFFENGFFWMVEKLSHWKKKTYTKNKIYDIKSKAPILSDDQFMDTMLAKISLHGESSLTSQEKERMTLISQRKSSKNK